MIKTEIPVDTCRRLVSPKPTALITVKDDRGDANIIAIAAITVVSHNPPMYMIAVREDRHSHDLIKEAGEFVINMPSKDMINEAHLCGRISGRDQNKFEKTGLTPIQGKRVKSPLIKECPINIECKVVEAVKPGTHTLFIGEVVAASVEESVFDETKIDLDKFQTILFNYDEYRSPGTVLKRT